ncbi:hypothetical protein DKX38_023078 [Salix brachista]|uniref:Uncharacterized protein n=1 Tax=Salix brachista TaxID=2182728 RepID=A0A5N5K161_9ROSI|nr:hypothetical protein DKX38_023078 [Salix brachista]
MEDENEKIGADIVAKVCSRFLSFAKSYFLHTFVSLGFDLRHFLHLQKQLQLQSAVSIAGIVLTTQAVLVEKIKKPRPAVPYVPGITP